MAKVRVYELAKDLNMTNKQLLEKLKELKIDVKSHMSALGSSDVAAVRQNLSGKKKRTDEVKDRPSVIRRRRTKMESQADELEKDEDMGDSIGPEEPTVQDSDDQEDAQETEGDAVAEVQAEAPGTQDSEDATESKKEKNGKRPARKVVSKSSEPAKIIKPAKVEKPPEPEPEEVAVDVEKKIEKAPVEEENTVTPQKDEKPETPMVDAELEDENKEITPESEDSREDKSLQEPVIGDQKASQEQKQKTAQRGGEESPEDGNSQGKRKKKKKKTAPAKIVRVADPMILENIKRMKAEDHHSGNGKDHGRPARKQPEPETGSSDVPDQSLVMPSAAPNDRKQRGKNRDEPQSPDALESKKKRRKKKSVVEGNDLYRGRSGRKKRGKKDSKSKKGNFQKTQITTPKAIKRRVKIDEAIELAELAKRMGIKANEMIAKLMGMGVMATVNQTIDFETAALVAGEFDFEVEKASFEEDTLLQIETENKDKGSMIKSPPVVTIMGHVDHGKTSLLDVIRKSKI